MRYQITIETQRELVDLADRLEGIYDELVSIGLKTNGMRDSISGHFFESAAFFALQAESQIRIGLQFKKPRVPSPGPGHDLGVPSSPLPGPGILDTHNVEGSQR